MNACGTVSQQLFAHIADNLLDAFSNVIRLTTRSERRCSERLRARMTCAYGSTLIWDSFTWTFGGLTSRVWVILRNGCGCAATPFTFPSPLG